MPLDSDCGNTIPVTVTVSLRRLEAFTWLKPSKCDISEQKPSRSQRGKTREAPSETLYLSGKLLHTFNGTSTFQLQRELQACGDISPNPGPKGKPNLKYPCSECHKSVRQNQDGIRCAQYSTWFHVKCLHMTDTIFRYYLKYPDIDWTCTLCALPSFSESFFMDSENEFSDSSFSSSEDQLNEELSYSAFSESSLSVGSTNQLQHSLEGTDGEGIVTNINSDDFYLHQFSKETRRGVGEGTTKIFNLFTKLWKNDDFIYF